MSGPSGETGIAERKLITALFCDLIGSTALGERLDPETLGRVQAAYFDRLRSVIEAHGGIVEKFIGDAVVAVFGVPVTHEDDAERAIRCALGMREAMAGLNDTLRPRFGVELAVRIGVDSGEAVVTGRTADAIATGDVLNTAARLEAAAGPGEILVGRDTMSLARETVMFRGPRSIEARGKARPVEAWMPSEVSSERMRPRAAMVGRVAELELLSAALERAVGGSTGQVVIVLGEPGIGKSRLSEEFAGRVTGRATVLRGACRSYGADTVWGPLADVVRAAAGIESASPESAAPLLRQHLEGTHAAEEATLIEAQLAPLIGAGRTGATSGGEVLWAFRRFLEAIAADRPTVVVLDDLHWGTDTLLETLEELAETVAPVPLLLIFQGRPELRDRMAGTLAHDRTSVIALGGLSGPEAALLVAGLQSELSDETRDLKVDRSAAIVGQAAGNPLYLEEIASMAAHHEAVDEVPRSIQALIAARLDLLAPATKLVGQAAAVVGEIFWAGGVTAALSNGERPDTAPALRTLRTRGLIEEQPGSAFLGDRQFVFHHSLIRDVAYGSLPKQRRADMHRRVAEWMTPFAADRPELLGSVGHHWERALALVAETGRPHAGGGGAVVARPAHPRQTAL